MGARFIENETTTLTPKEILSKYWGYNSFRPLQEDIIGSVLNGGHTLALLPTGGGKSICFQIPGMILEGVCLVVSPLIALMRDQVSQLQRRNIKAVALYSGMSRREIDITLDNCLYGEVKFLYVSPERLQSSLFLARAERMNFSLVAVDEAHCISQWGYDFRPPYLEIHEFIANAGVDRVIALTATATKRVQEDIVDKLHFSNPHLYVKSFARENLSYSVFNLENKQQKLLEVLNGVRGSAVVYCRSRKKTETIARGLREAGIPADYYHAGLSGPDRERRQEAWITGRIRVIVATNAFGMGIDKPDVRSVVHVDLPDSLEAYYQEAGRAGRDEKKAYAVLLFNEADAQRLRDQVERATVSLKGLRRVYQALANHYKLAVGSKPEKSFPLDLEQFASTFDIPALEVFNSLKKLQQEGVVALSDSFFHSSKVFVLQRKEELYRFQVAHPRLDAVIKTLLRLYGGQVFQEFVSIKEGDLAKALKVPREQIVQWLDTLVQYEVIDYAKQLHGTQITFVQARMDPNELPIEEEELARRAKISLDKAEAVINYAHRRDRCRTRMLQAYFDELSDEDCGICDFCIARKRKGHFIEPAELLEFLQQHAPLKVSDIPSHQRDWGLDTVKQSLRILIEDGRVHLLQDEVHLSEDEDQ